jgi:hypothetical protein
MYGLVLNGWNGTLSSNDWWTGNFLTLKYQGVETMIDPSLLRPGYNLLATLQPV